MANWDAIVIGLGGVGSSAAYHLSLAGLRVLGVDQFEPVHDHGSSHGQTRIIRQAYFEHPAYVPLLRRAYQLWDELQEQSEVELFQRTGLVELGPSDGVVIPGVLASAAEHDLEIEVLTPSEITRRWPGIRGQQDWQAVVEQNAGLLHVEACVRAHLRLAIQAGATCRHGVSVESWQASGDGVTVVCDGQTEHAGKLIIAAGPWSAGLLADVGMSLQVLRKHQYWFEPKGKGCEIKDGFPCFFHETSDGYYYGFPDIDGSGVKVSRHSGGEQIDQPSDRHPKDEADRQHCQNYVSEFLPGVSTRVNSSRGCYYTVTPDEHFVVDHHPQHDNVVVVAGLSGHGFKFTSVLGQFASELTLRAAKTIDLELFRFRR
ncbi:MAG: N-methyl-L-tryptophan oxidase [Rubripirellula sp.]